jgi:hypothetical protein
VLAVWPSEHQVWLLLLLLRSLMSAALDSLLVPIETEPLLWLLLALLMSSAYHW